MARKCSAFFCLFNRRAHGKAKTVRPEPWDEMGVIMA
jgi:hypothetical protein